MKSVTVQIEKDEFDRVLKQASPGDAVILTDGDRQIRFPAFDVNEDSPELEAELLKAVDGPFSDYSRAELEAITARVLAEKKKE
jgi:hypothetical protein